MALSFFFEEVGVANGEQVRFIVPYDEANDLSCGMLEMVEECEMKVAVVAVTMTLGRLMASVPLKREEEEAFVNQVIELAGLIVSTAGEAVN